MTQARRSKYRQLKGDRFPNMSTGEGEKCSSKVRGAGSEQGGTVVVVTEEKRGGDLRLTLE